MPANSIDDVRSAAEQFTPAGESFKFIPLEEDQWRDHQLLEAARPGVYVWFDREQGRVVRVGMSTVNARARALKHIQDDTGGKMAKLAEQSRLKMLLFTRADSERNSISEFEKHLESTLDPLIPSLN